jgi:hypothetical protein
MLAAKTAKRVETFAQEAAKVVLPATASLSNEPFAWRPAKK